MPTLSPVHSLHQASRLYLYVRSVDMRRSFDGLHAIVQNEFKHNVQGGDMFLFLNKRRDRIKILWWDGDGMAIFMKRLEAGTYQLPTVIDEQVSLVMDRIQVELLLSGIELSSVKRRKRYQAIVDQPLVASNTSAK
jgi:transposase